MLVRTFISIAILLCTIHEDIVECGPYRKDDDDDDDDDTAEEDSFIRVQSR